MKSSKSILPSTFPILINKPLRERIAEILQTSILNGELKLGQPLVESDIATQLGVSRAPVREAVQILASKGLVDVVAYKGAHVRVLDAQEVHEVYSLRSVLEGFAAERLASHNTPADLAELRGICHDMLLAAKTGVYNHLLETDEAFHRTLVKLARHGLLYDAWNDLSMRVRQIMALSNLQFVDTTEIFFNHLPIVEALEAKDQARAASLVRSHILSSATFVVQSRLPL